MLSIYKQKINNKATKTALIRINITETFFQIWMTIQNGI